MIVSTYANNIFLIILLYQLFYILLQRQCNYSYI
nr:MAG TPA: hypothetical protein [Caudoviricetes sp.]